MVCKKLLFAASEDAVTIKPTALSRLQLRFENGQQQQYAQYSPGPHVFP